MSIRSTILAQLEQVAKEQSRTLSAPNDSVALTETGLDSLCFAIVVARLEDELGFDPFASAEDTQYPVTLGDFIKFYENAAR
jgi:acyl carrier protein